MTPAQREDLVAWVAVLLLIAALLLQVFACAPGRPKEDPYAIPVDTE